MLCQFRGEGLVWHSAWTPISISGTFTDDRQVKTKTYTPAVPEVYGTISYEYNGLGQKTAMTVPLGIGNKGRRYQYSYDNTGKQTGMSQYPATVTSNTTLPSVTGDNQTHFTYDDAQNRVKMQTKAGGVYHFVYDPTASIPAVVYEQGPEYRYLNVREPDGSLDCFDTAPPYNSRRWDSARECLECCQKGAR